MFKRIPVSWLGAIILALTINPSTGHSQTLSFDSFGGSASATVDAITDSFSGTVLSGAITQPPAGGSGVVQLAEPIVELNALAPSSCGVANVLAERGDLSTVDFDWDFTFRYVIAAAVVNPADDSDPCFPGLTGSASIDGTFAATLSVPADTPSWNLKYGVETSIGGEATGTFNLNIVDSANNMIVDQTGPTGPILDPFFDLVSLDIMPPEGGEIYTITISGTATVTAFPILDGNVASAIGNTRLIISVGAILPPPPNDAPVADADGPYQGVVGVPVPMDASGSFDPESAPLTFSWNFGDGSTLQTADAMIEHTYGSPGIFPVTLVVNDGELDSAPFITDATISDSFPGGGQRADVDAFLTYANPLQKSTDLPAGTSSVDVTIIYGNTIDPATFQAFVNRVPSGAFNPVAGTSETVNIPLASGRNVLLLLVRGVRSDGRTATDRDRLTFVVP